MLGTRAGGPLGRQGYVPLTLGTEVGALLAFGPDDGVLLKVGRMLEPEEGPLLTLGPVLDEELGLLLSLGPTLASHCCCYWAGLCGSYTTISMLWYISTQLKNNLHLPTKASF